MRAGHCVVVSKTANLAADALRNRKRKHKVVPFPVGPGDEPFDIGIVVLTHDEIREAEIAAVKFVTAPERKLDAVQLAILSPNALVEQERDLFVLSRAIVHADKPDMPLWDVEMLRKLTVEERIWLMGAYNAFAEERSPLKKAAKPEEVSAFLAELKRTGALSTWVMCSDSDTLRSTVLLLVEALPVPTMLDSSDTSPQS